MKNFHIIDCTLRDGGYYTNWNFDTSLVRELIKTLDKNGIDIIELGYKSPLKGGAYRKCNDGFIKNIVDFETKNNLAFMIDAKDFVNKNGVDFDLLSDCIKDKDKSPFSVCRLAIKLDEIEIAVEIAKFIIQKGYRLFVNLMTVSLLSEENVLKFLITMSPLAEVLYIADSYGNLTPDKVSTIAQNCVVAHNKSNGIHCHDNLGLAFANSLSALNNGFDYVDSTMLGMGRGVGNTKTEQVLIYRNNQITADVLDILEEFQKLQTIYKWGFNSLYMLGGLHHTHPLYLQDINSSNLNNEQKIKTTKELYEIKSYQQNLLEKYKVQKSVVVIPARYKSSRFPGKPLTKILGKEMILHVAERAAQAVGKENVYIATENDEISKVAKQNAFNVVLTSDNCLTGTDRIAESAMEIDADIYVNVQGDEPMINPEDILMAIQEKKNNPDYVINCMAKLNYDEKADDKKIPKIVCDSSNRLLYASRNIIPGRKIGTSKNIMKQVCIYAFSKKELQIFHSANKTTLENEEDIEILRFLEKGVNVKMLEVQSVTYAVDYPEDVIVVENKLRST